MVFEYVVFPTIAFFKMTLQVGSHWTGEDQNRRIRLFSENIIKKDAVHLTRLAATSLP